MGRRTEGIEIGTTEPPAVRFVRLARLCRIRDFKQLLALSDLVKGIGELIHTLQKERGAASIFLGSNGVKFSEQFAARAADCRAARISSPPTH